MFLALVLFGLMAAEAISACNFVLYFTKKLHGPFTSVHFYAVQTFRLRAVFLRPDVHLHCHI